MQLDFPPFRQSFRDAFRLFLRLAGQINVASGFGHRFAAIIGYFCNL